MKIKPSIYATSLSAFINLMWVYVVYFLCRLAYALENWSVLGGNLNIASIGEILKGGCLFDTSAIMYTNVLYMVLMLLPLHFKESRTWQKIAKYLLSASMP